jgi:deazaflavin-dependent oxidoreductase (nitroreductase family)
MSTKTEVRQAPSLPPRWFIRAAWMAHRTLVRASGGRWGLSEPTVGGRFGMLRLHTLGRRSGRERVAILGYYEDGPNLVTLAMNGWAEPEPAWLLNLLVRGQATVDLPYGARVVRGRIADGEERARLWAGWGSYRGYGDDLDAYATLRPAGVAVVVLEPVERPAEPA